MRVLHVCSYFGDRFYRELMRAERAAGIDLDVFYFAQNGSAPLPVEDADYLRQAFCYNRLDRISYFGKQEKALRALKKTYAGERFDLLHAHSLFSNGYLCRRLKKKLGLPYVVAVRSGDVNQFFARVPLLRGVGAAILREADGVVFLSEKYRDLVLGKYVPAKWREEIQQKCAVVPNGIARVFLENPGAPKAYAPEDRRLRLITVAFVNDLKNQRTVCRAAGLLETRGYQVRYRVIGRKEDEGYAEEVLRDPRVEYSGAMPQEQLIGEYRAADVFVMPSHKETFGLTYVESMSQGVPVIYSRGQGFDGQFPEGEVGFAVEPDSAEEIADAVERILKDYKRMSENAVNGSARFEWSAIAARYRDLYAALIKGQGREI